MREEREEGGAPGILGDVKLGLVVLLKQSFGKRYVTLFHNFNST